MPTRPLLSSSHAWLGAGRAALNPFQEPADGDAAALRVQIVDAAAARALPLAAAPAMATVRAAPMSANIGFTPTDDEYAVDEDGTLLVVAPGVLENDGLVDNAPSATLDTGPGNGSLLLQSDGSFEYLPFPDFHGVDDFYYTATYFDLEDVEHTSGPVHVVIYVNPVNDPFTLASDFLSFWTNEDETLWVSSADGPLAGADDPDGDFLGASLYSAPSSGDVTVAVDGSFEYVPFADASGDDYFEIAVSDGEYLTVVGVAVHVEPVNDPPYGEPDFLSAMSGTQTRISLYDLIGNDTDPEDDPLGIFIDSQPAHGFVEYSGDGGFFYTSEIGFNGPDTFTYVVADDFGNSDPITVTMDVFGGNQAPVAYPDSYEVNAFGSLDVDATAGVLANDDDPDSPFLYAMLVGDVGFGTLTLNADGSFVYEPTPGFSGIDNFSYYATDGSADSEPEVVTITVNPVDYNVPAVAVPDEYFVDEDGVLTVPAPGVLDNDYDPDNPSSFLYADVATPPAAGDLVWDSNGSFTYTPVAGFHGDVTFTYTTDDGYGPGDPGQVTIHVRSVNDVPVALGDEYAAVEDTPLVVAVAQGVLANDDDDDAGDVLTAVLVTGPSHGTLLLGGDGSFTYQGAADYFGPDSFSYKAFDGAAESGVVTVALNVAGVQDAPRALDDFYATNEDRALTVVVEDGVLANDDDVDGNPLTAVLVDGPSHGSLFLQPAGNFLYQAFVNYHGTDTFTYRANDGTADSPTRTVTIDVRSVNDTPDPVTDDYSVGMGQQLTVDAPGVLGNDRDVDDDALTVTGIVFAPQHGTVVIQPTGSFVYTPDAGFTGLDFFLYGVADPFTAGRSTAVRVNVLPNVAPVSENDLLDIDEDGSVTVTAPGVLDNDHDDDGHPLTANLVDAPLHGDLVLQPDGAYTYTPFANYHGPDAFTYKANDGFGDGNLATVSITVAPVNDAPVARVESYNGGEDLLLLRPANRGGVLGNDDDVDGDPLTAVLVTGPSHGTLRLGPDGGVEYQPAPDYFGPDGFSYRAFDGTALSEVSQVNITISPLNDAPTGSATATLPDAQPGVPFFVATSTLLQGFQDVDDAVLTVQSLGGDGTITPVAGGFEVLVPVGFAGPGHLSYEVTDGENTPLPAALQYGVTTGNQGPVVTTLTLSPAREHLINATLDGFGSKILGTLTASDADGDALTWSISDDPTGGALRIDAKTGVLSVRDVSLLDVEGPGVFTNGGSYVQLAVQVTDGTNTATQHYALQLDDVVNAGVTAGTDFVDGTATGQVLAAGIGNDVLFGDDGADNLAGGAGWDYLYGGPGADILNGGDFDDHLFGGAGADTLTGGANRDWFVFSTPPGEVDTITDFVRYQDVLWLVNDAPGLFTALPNGPLAQAAFDVVGAGPAASAATRVSYDPATGLLAYDPDGTGSTASANFANIGRNVPIVAADVVAGPNPTRDNAAPLLAGPVPALPAGQVNLPTTITTSALLAGFSDADGDPLSIVGLRSNVGTLVDQGNGSWTLNTPLNFVGAVTLAFGVSDGQAITAGARLQPIAAGSGTAPSFTSGTTLATVREHLFNATATGITSKTLGAVVAQDPDGQPVSYALLSDSSGGAFALDASSGVVTVRDLALLDFEGPGLSTDAGGRFHSLGIAASDGTFSTTQVVKVYVTDVAAAGATGGNDWLDRGDGNDVLNSGAGTDFVFGDGGSDTLTGGASWDYLYGGTGVDTMTGNDGDDTFYGGPGGDTMTGGNGRDTFAFAGTDGGGIDLVTDFNVLTDRLMLVNDRGPFDVLPNGTLAAAAFDVVGVGPASNAGTRVLYNPATGALFFDADGTGPAAAVQLATLAPNLALTAGNVVAQPFDFP